MTGPFRSGSSCRQHPDLVVGAGRFTQQQVPSLGMAPVAGMTPQGAGSATAV
jgi:hypothetical protein